jgi:hypothetical protein
MPCSYCRNSEHTINYCDSPSIRIHYDRLKDNYERILRSGYNAEVAKESFTNYHLRSGRRYLKAVAVRYAGALSSWNNRELLNAIWMHFTEVGSVPNPGISNGISNGINYDNSFIIDYINPNDLAGLGFTMEDRPLSPIITDQFNVLDWAIDRNPSPNGHINVDNPINSDHINYNLIDYTSRHPNYNRPSNYNLATVIRNLMGDFVENDQYIPSIPISKERRLQMLNIVPVLDVSNKLDNQCKWEDCSICYEEVEISDEVVLNCGHQFCGLCIDKTINTYTNYGKPLCALCRTEISTLNIKNQEIYKQLVSSHTGIDLTANNINEQSLEINIIY